MEPSLGGARDSLGGATIGGSSHGGGAAAGSSVKRCALRVYKYSITMTGNT